MLRIASSPHIRSPITTRSIMLSVIVALVPAGVFGVVHFGVHALYLILAAVASAVAWEALMQRALKKSVTIDDMSAVVTGLLLAYNLPSTAPIWLAVVGSGIAIVLVKQIFGGLGKNFMNPAAAARAILLTSWVGLMSGTVFDVPGIMPQLTDAVSSATDAISAATPLLAADPSPYSLSALFLGTIPGTIGEVSKICLLAGGTLLIAIRVINWRVPVAMLGTAFVLFWIASGRLVGTVDSAVYQLLSGGLMLGALFMATDYATSPVSPMGKILFGVGCGALVFTIRRLNPNYPEGASYAILIMNCVTPMIDKYVRPRVYGEVKRRG